MGDERVQALVEQAVGRQFEAWAREHPSLAAAIDRVAVVDRASRRLRESDDYRAAVGAYRQARDEQRLLAELADLAQNALAVLLR